MRDKVMTVFEYFDYALFVNENGHYKEMCISNTSVKFGAFLGEVTEENNAFSKIHSIVQGNSISDVVMVIVYEMRMSESGYDKLAKMFNNLSEERLILDIFKQNLYNEGLVIKSMTPIVFQNRIRNSKFVS